MPLKRGRNIEGLLKNKSKMPEFLRQGLLSERINAMSPSGPSSFDKGYADSEAIEERLMDEASMSGGQSPDWESLPSSGPSVYKQNYSDSEAMEQRRMDEASEQGGGVDWESLPSSGPELFQKKPDTSLDSFIKSSNRSNEERGIWDDVKEGASNLVEKGKGLLSQEEESNIKEVTNPAFAKLLGSSPMMDEGSLGEAEGAEAARILEKRQAVYGMDDLNQKGPREDTEGGSALDQIGAANRGKATAMADFSDEEGGGFWNEVKGLLDSDSIGEPEKKKYRDVDTEGDNRYLNKLAREEFESGKIDTPFADRPSYTRIKEDTEGESALDRIGAEDRGRIAAMADFKGEEEGTGKYQGGNQFGVLGEKLSGAYDSVKDWFGSGGEDSAEDKAGKKKLGAALMKGALGGGGAQPPGGRMSMPTSKTVRGQVAFPGLLNKPKRQKNPYFMPKGLV